MQVATGKIVDGKVVVDGVALPEGAIVTVFAEDVESIVRLPPALQAELEEALDEADLEHGVSAQALLESLRKYG